MKIVSAIRRFEQGFRSPFRGLKLLVSKPGLWPLCIAPIVINVAIAIIAWIWFRHLAAVFLAQHVAGAGFWAGILHWLLVAILWLCRLVGVLATIVIIGNLATIPFNDPLSGQIDALLLRSRGLRPEEIFVKNHTLVGLAVQELKRVFIYATLMICLFILSFLGPVAPFALAIQVFASAWFFALEYFSYPLERRGQFLLASKFAFVRKNLPASLGFGACMTLIGVVPLVNFVFIPLGVAGATLLHGEMEAEVTQRRIRAL